jgi:putative aldouronate transport system permease protein
MVRSKKLTFRVIKSQWQLLVLSVPFIILVIVFNYLPIWGWVYSFFEATPQTLRPNFDRFLGFDMFVRVFNNSRFWDALRNTIAISIIGLVLGYVTSIGFAVLLNEIRIKWFKRSVQTISYLPYFISWVVAATMISVTLSPDGGIFNEILLRLGIIDKPVNFFLINGPGIWMVLVLSQIWKNLGWNSIIYLSAMAGIDPGMYESAQIDGAGRIRRIWSITIPSIMPIIRLLLILSMGNMLRVGFEQYLLMQRPLSLGYSEIIDTLTYRTVWGSGNPGRMHRDISYATAIGMMNSLVSLILLISANKISHMVSGERLF